MKILVTESQLHKILKEDLGKNDPQLNAILDKALSMGFESLTPDELEMLHQMSQNKSGDEIEADREPSEYPGETEMEPDTEHEDNGTMSLPRELDNPAYIMFVHLFPREIINFKVDGNPWIIRLVGFNDYEKLVVSPDDGSHHIFMTPFWNENKIIVDEEGTDVKNSMTIDPNRVPQSEEDMHRFISEFIRMMPGIIKRLTT